MSLWGHWLWVCVWESNVPACAGQFEILFVFRWSEHSQNHAGRQQGLSRAAAVWLWSGCLLPQRLLLSLDTVNWIWLFTRPFVGPGFCFVSANFDVFFFCSILFLLLLEFAFSLSFSLLLYFSLSNTHTHAHTLLCISAPSVPAFFFFFYPPLSWLNPLVWSIIDDPRCLEGSGGKSWLAASPHPPHHTHTHTHTLDTHTHLLHPAHWPLLSFQDQS